MNQLPAHLANLPVSGLAARAAEGIGSALPPHISIRGNAFTLVDAAGNKQPAQTTFLDVCIADISDVMCKQFYENDWSPDSDEPPACWSANGIAPSVEAINPQSPLCSTCPQNVRGSDTSRLSGKAIKACRDEKWLAVLVAGVPMPLQLKLTPGSFTNFRSYVELFKGKPIDMCHVFTRLQFEANKNGVLTFSIRPQVQGGPAAWIDEAVAAMYTHMKNTKASDVLVGRTDRPRQPALAAPERAMLAQQGTAGQAQITREQPLREDQYMDAQGNIHQKPNQPQGFQPAPFGGAPGATSQSIAPAAQSSTNAGVQTAQSPSEQPQQRARRTRRTADQIAADNAAAAGGAPQQGAQTQPSQFAPTPGVTAPFAQPAAGATTSGPAFGASNVGTTAPFGIAQNPAAPPDALGASLDQLFGNQGGQ